MASIPAPAVAPAGGVRNRMVRHSLIDKLATIALTGNDTSAPVVRFKC